jgi:DNA-binding PadR family transcriptional regulator
MRKLSELEGVVLGLVQKEEPCSAYSVRIGLKSSPSSHWRASAGAIYPLIHRLEENDLLTATVDLEDLRGKKALRITLKGQEALRTWIKEGTSEDVASSLFDPIRTRLFFLGCLSETERGLFIKDTLQSLEKQLASAEAFLKDRPAAGDLFDHLAATAGLINARSRLEFMTEVDDRLSKAAKAQ